MPISPGTLALPVIPLILWATPAVAAAALFALLLLNPAGNAGLGAYRVAITPPDLQGRVQAAAQFLSLSVMPLAPVLGGTLLTHLGGPGATLILTAATAATALIPTLSASIRAIPGLRS